MQPSAQGIASLFMGNPGALAARVDQDRKQSPMGIPDDLRQLMALNIVTTENDAAKRQQALSELQQMAPNGQPPTVADNVRQQAAQKLQAQMVQEQQKQQALQQMMSGLPAVGVPENVPQPQGIDQAPVEFGMAGGGIVSFQDGGSVEERYRRESEEMGEGKRLRFSPDVQEYARRLRAQREGEQADYASREHQRMLRESREIAPEQIRLAGDPNVTRETMRRVGPMTAPRFEDPRIVRNAPGITAPEAPVAPPTTSGRRTTSAGLPAALPAVTQAPKQEPVAPTPAPIEDRRLSEQGLLNAASAARLQELEEYGRLVGRPDTSALDRLVAEYERQKAATEGPKAGWDAFTEYMAQIAAGARPGRSSLQAGAAGALGVQALEKERAAQRAALTEKQIGLEQRKLDVARDYAKDLFGVGKAAYDKAYDRNFNMYKDQGLDLRAAQDRAHQTTLEDLRYKRQIEQEERRFKNDMKLRGMPTAEMQRQDRLIKMYMEEQEAKGNKVTYLQAVQAIGALGQSERMPTPTDRLRAAQSILNDPMASDEEKTFARTEIKDLMSSNKSKATGAQPLPANATPKDLVVGTVYQTARGPAKWDGKQFMPI